MTDSKQPIVLITGLPRSGTSWMVNSLNLHPEILAFGETHFFSRNWFRPRVNGSYTPRQLEALWTRLSSCPFWSSVPLKKDLGVNQGWLLNTSQDDIPDVISSARRMVGPEPKPADVLHALGQSFCEREGKRFWVEKTAIEGKYVSKIAKLIPGIRFVLTIREPLGFFRSYKFQGIQHGADSRRRHEERYHPFLCMLVWRMTIRSVRKLQKRNPEQVSVVILSSDSRRREALQEVCRHLGVAPDEAMYSLQGDRVNSSDVISQERTLSRADMAWIRFFCKVDDPELRFDDAQVEAGVLDLLRSMAGIPRWGVRLLFRKWIRRASL